MVIPAQVELDVVKLLRALGRHTTIDLDVFQMC